MQAHVEGNWSIPQKRKPKNIAICENTYRDIALEWESHTPSGLLIDYIWNFFHSRDTKISLQSWTLFSKLISLLFYFIDLAVASD